MTPCTVTVIGHVGTADGAEQDGVVLLKGVPAVVGHHAAMLLVVRGAPRQAVPIEDGILVTAAASATRMA